jgi:hypothetical protein
MDPEMEHLWVVQWYEVELVLQQVQLLDPV